MDNLVRSGLWAGIPLRDIESMTAEDIGLTAEVERERLTDHYRMMAWLAYNGAALTGVAVNDPRRFPALE